MPARKSSEPTATLPTRAKAAPKTTAKAAAKPAKAASQTKTKAAAKAESPESDATSPSPAPAEKTKPKTAAAVNGASKPSPSAAKRKASVSEPRATKRLKADAPQINAAPDEALEVFVFGEGSSGELGLGSKKYDGSKKPIDVKRPRINHFLDPKTVGVVQIACGGMHCVALTKDNKIYTWGVNDQGALGRDTKWDEGLRDLDADSDSDDEDDTGMNPHESTPKPIDNAHFAPGTKFAQVVACDSASFVLTTDGRVYGWGTFRSSDGIMGFSRTVKVQSTPVLMPTLKNVKTLAAGSNHILALDTKGSVLAWGCGQQNQLGRRVIERNKMSSLEPQGLGLPRNKIVKIACGSYHSFAVDKDGRVWAWGLNNFGELGVDASAGESDSVVLKPALVQHLDDYKIKEIAGGEHHSLAVTETGEVLSWGRVDGYQVGFEFDDLSEENSIYDERGKPRILFKPTVLKGIPSSVSVTAGVDNSFAITEDGKAYSWGFSSNYQTGHGTLEDIHVPTHIDNTAVRGKHLVGAGAGGQYSVLLSKADDTEPNGVNGSA